MLNSNIKNRTRTEKLLPLIFALFLPGLAFFSNRFLIEQYAPEQLIPQWLGASLILLFLWYFNDWLSNRNFSRYYLLAVVLNGILATVYVFLIVVFLPDQTLPQNGLYFTIGVRVMMAAAIIVTIQQSLKSTRTIEKLKTENLSLKAERYKAELDQIRKQVNPHFLFNSLSTLRTMVRKGNTGSETFVVNLASLYRQILQSRDKNTVSLEEEVKFLNAYIYLLKVRHEDSLQIHIDINPSSEQYSIPIFALQILVENCVKHNVLSESKPLSIRIYQKDDLTITVSNNLQPKQENTDSTGVGLDNLLERYRLIGIKDGLNLEQTNNEFNATVKLF